MEDIHIKEDEPVTVVLNYEILDKDEEAFKKTTREVIDAAKQFKGFRGKHYFYTQLPGKRNYNILIQFDNLADLKRWEESPVRMQLRDKINQFVANVPKYHYLTGLESWFSLGVNQPIIPPPRYKIALLTWASAYCLLLIIFTLVGSYLAEIVMPLRVLIVSLILVSLISYVVMPFLTRLFKRWLYPNLATT